MIAGVSSKQPSGIVGLLAASTTPPPTQYGTTCTVGTVYGMCLLLT